MYDINVKNCNPIQGNHLSRVAVFDLDGTLVAGDSFGKFLKWRITDSAARFFAALVTSPVWLVLLLCPRTRILGERCLIWLASAGLDSVAYEAVIYEFSIDHVASDKSSSSQDAISRLREYHANGYRVLVVTACAEPLATAVCQAAQIHSVEVIASTLTRTVWGFPRNMCVVRGENKPRALEAVGVDLPVDHAYSDSWSDLPLLTSARTPHLVAPSTRDLARFKRVFGERVDVLS